MRFNKSVTALAFIAAVTVFGGHTAYATDTTGTEIASDPSVVAKEEAQQPAAPKVTTVTIKQGDTLTSIAARYDVKLSDIISRNHIDDPDVINSGTKLKILVPAAHKPAHKSATAHYDELEAAAEAFMTPEQQAAPTAEATAAVVSASPAAGAAHASRGGANTYVWGTCTWYVKNRKPNIGNMWGNGGYEWLSSARASGYATGSKPVAGAIGVESGHVVYVESVHGSQVRISEMNYGGGVGVVHYRTVPASEFQYIYA